MSFSTYVSEAITLSWIVDFHDEFVSEYDELHEDVQDELLAIIEALKHEGPHMGRPRVDTLNGLQT